MPPIASKVARTPGEGLPSLAAEIFHRELALAADRRRLWAALGVALGLHGLLFLLHLPPASEVLAVERPERRIYKVQPPPRFIPPEPPVVDTPTRRPTVRPIPVPDWLVVEPVREPEPMPVPPWVMPAPEGWLVIPPGPPSPVAEPGGSRPLEVGGEVRAPVKVHAPLPRYPETARRVRLEGTVMLRAVIDEEGRVVDLEVLKGAPLGLTEAALAAARQWLFAPATLRGQPVPVYFNLSVDFRLR